MTRDEMTRFFRYMHLPPHLQEISRPFSELAETLWKQDPQAPAGSQRALGFQKLLEAKDCFVRDALK